MRRVEYLPGIKSLKLTGPSRHNIVEYVGQEPATLPCFVVLSLAPARSCQPRQAKSHKDSWYGSFAFCYTTALKR